MVIGDSLAQGCHSLSVRAEFSRMSYAAQATDLLKVPFVSPTFPWPVLFDLEEIIRDYLVTFPFSLQPLLHQLDKNLNDWRAHFKKPSAKAPEWFDNLAIAGSTLDQVEKLNYENTLAVLEANKEFNFQDPFKIKNRELFDLHVGINSGFVLNPLGKKEYAAYNMLKWVEVRKPRNLVE